MESRQLGGSGLKVPVLSLGTGTSAGVSDTASDFIRCQPEKFEQPM